MKLRRYLQPLVLIILLFAGFSAYGVWYAHVGNESAKAVGLAKQVEIARLKSVHTQQMSQKLQQAATDEAAIRGYFVNTTDVVPFLQSLQDTGSQFGSKVEVVSVSSVSAKPHAKLDLSLTITGPFDSVERTLGAIEYQPFDTQVQNLTLDTSGGSAGAAPEWSAAVTLTVGTVDQKTVTPARAAAPAQAHVTTSSTSTPIAASSTASTTTP